MTMKNIQPVALFCLMVLSAATARSEPAPTASILSVENFFAPVPDPGAKLPANGIYPNGRRLAYMGYSGKAERDLANGFSVAGPVYGDQSKYLEECFAHHIPVVAQVDTGVRFVHPKGKTPPPLDLAQAEAKAKEIVTKYAGHDEIIWWAIEPEELRPWVKQEMELLVRITKVVRDNDPRKRPVFLYNPNHRDAGSLKTITAQVDILGKGSYTNGTGHKDDRAWVRWGIDQEMLAVEREKKATGRTVLPILMPEMSTDPKPDEDTMIESWIRHDVYLGMCSGAKGVLLWSLAPRKGFGRTWKIWYEAYALCGRELNSERHLGEVFLFGTPKNDLIVTPGPVAGKAVVVTESEGETGTTTKAERQSKSSDAPDFTICERALGLKRYLFVVNSTGGPRDFAVTGWPGGTKFTDAFTGKPVNTPDSARFTLPSWGVRALEAEAEPR